MTQNVIAAQRLYLTADKQALVGEGDVRAATLYAAQGDEIPAEMAEKFGLQDGALPGSYADADAAAAEAAAKEAAEKAAAEAAAKQAAAKEAAEAKARKAPANKARPAAENKGA